MTPARAVTGIRGWPEDERPRERLLKQGPHVLSNAELLAILVRMGPKGQDAVGLGRALLKRFKTLNNLAQRLPQEFTSQPGLGPAKAATIAAAFELGRRLMSEREHPRAQFRSSADVASHFLPKARGLRREVFKIAMLDSAHRLMKVKTITVGTLNLALVHPREVFREAVVESAAGVVLLHNHPSGDPAPSEEDIKLTRQLVRGGEAVGIPILDHIILGSNRYYSFADTRKLSS